MRRGWGFRLRGATPGVLAALLNGDPVSELDWQRESAPDFYVSKLDVLRLLQRHWTLASAWRFLEALDPEDPEAWEHLRLALRGERAKAMASGGTFETDSGTIIDWEVLDLGLEHLGDFSAALCSCGDEYSHDCAHLGEEDIQAHVRGVLAMFDSLTEPSSSVPAPVSALLVELATPAAASGTPDHLDATGESPPPRPRDTHLGLAAPHGPTPAGVMPVAA